MVVVPAELSEDVLGFLEQHIDSVYQLELLLYLRTEPTRDWTAQAVAERLHLLPESVRATLGTLCSSGLLEQGPNSTYRFSTQNEELFGLMDRVARAYSSYRVRIINVIHSSERSRKRDPIRSFADAFRLGPESERDPSDDGGK